LRAARAQALRRASTPLHHSSKKDVDGRVKRAFTPVFDGLRPAMTMSNENPDFIDRISGQALRTVE
jgi:hypothetical protein